MNAIAKIRYSHDAMIDLIIQNPSVSQNELALSFGYTAGWVSQVIASDAFQARLAERKDELVDPTIRANIEDRFKALVVRSLEILREKLDRPAHQVPDQLVLRSLETANKALGFGVQVIAPPAPSGHNTVEQLAERLVSLQSDIRKRSALNGEAETVEVSLPLRSEGGENAGQV